VLFRSLSLHDDATGHFFFARWLVQNGRAPEARPHVDEAIRRSPAHADAQLLASRLSIALGTAPGRQWANYPSAFEAGFAAIGRRDWLAAAEANRDALRHDPRSADAFLNLGWSLAQLGFRSEAAAAYRQALVMRPGDTRAMNNLKLVQ